MKAISGNGVVTRFAPSPTGRLHLGHAFSAIRAHDAARTRGGRFLLRIEDIDGTRSRPEHVETILADLAWLGLDWDGEVLFQSHRLDVYAAALETLKARRLVYPCFCTRADIAREVAASVAAPHGVDGPIYPGTCRHLSDAERAARRSEPHALRLDIARACAVAGPLGWYDERAGAQVADPAAQGDVVLARKDAPASYHLAVTIDDAAQGVTHVVRGKDLFAATHVHRLLQALLGLPTPVYHHHALLTDATGARLAKRSGAPTLAERRLAGEDGRALAESLRRGDVPES
ncbi:glutamyl-Q tRNA(Asp) synthetase [Hephaestia caeni]|uniref:Glutamyl-Q tRNA(Asp) synthetase n=1 Tax=Hephaestia caeni TaxID=645617 RepID=A0A397P3F1_9SPHN|nr:tRNA glutamyl-Q(34) synthetase GluQRS [Hephaestia caeni]RIA44090.1 glutamyl-Q tRNA(Asp) synthetase [Hephaestia caeni]